MEKQNRQGVGAICYGLVFVIVGTAAYLVDVDAISAVGLFALVGGALAVLAGLVDVARSLSRG